MQAVFFRVAAFAHTTAQIDLHGRRRGGVVGRVLAAAAHQAVSTGAALEFVVALAAVELVIADQADQGVVSAVAR